MPRYPHPSPLPEVKSPLTGRSVGAIDVAASVRKGTVRGTRAATLSGSIGQKIQKLTS